LRVTDGPVETGTYVTDAAGKRLTFTVPEGRVGFGERVGGGRTGSFSYRVERAVLSFVGPVSNVYTDGCDWGRGSKMEPPPGPTIDDFTAALASVEDREVSEPTDVEVGGHRAKYLHITAPKGDMRYGFGLCDEGVFMEVTTPDIGLGHGDPGESWDVWIVDVDGDRYFIHSRYEPDTPQQKPDELLAIVESLTIEALP